MSLNLIFSHRRTLPAVALLAAWVAAGGCSTVKHVFHRGETAAPPTAMTHSSAPASDAAESAEPQTVTSNLPDADEPVATDAGNVAPTTVIADAGPMLAASAPKSYVVQKGDTLWGLAQMFLKDPWLWPEIWYQNPEVANPHRIYPGDTLRLAAASDGKTVVQVVPGAASVAGAGGRGTRLQPLLRSTQLDGPIANIPYTAIAAFLSRPGLISRQQVKAAPYIVSLRENHMIAGAGNNVYVKKLTAVEGERFNIMHVADRLKDPDSGKVLGYLADFTGVAQVARAGNPAKVTLTESARETLTGDILLPEVSNSASDFYPHAPTHAIKGRLLAVVNGVLLAGQYQVVAISGGANQGIEPGHVLRVNEASERVHDRCARIQGEGTCTRFGSQRLPVESAGTLLVFRSFEGMSYALVVSESIPLHVGDRVVTP
jgi:LysM repeat protein